MRPILKMLARLYPAEWRRRYGAEYEALLDEGTPRWRDAADVAWGAFRMQMTSWSFVRIVLVGMLLGTLAAVAASFARPTLYRSQTLVSVDTSDLRSLDLELAGQVHDALAEQTLIPIIQHENLYPTERARMPLSAVVILMRKNIEIRPLSTKGGKPAHAFVLQFSDPNPQVAQRVDERLVSELVASNLRERINGQSDAARAPETLTVEDAADLPQKPFSPNRPEFGVGGLLAGLFGGLILAAVGRLRRGSPVATG